MVGAGNRYMEYLHANDETGAFPSFGRRSVRIHTGDGDNNENKIISISFVYEKIVLHFIEYLLPVYFTSLFG